MPLPRKKDDGTGGAPVLDILRAKVRLIEVEEHVEPYVVTRKSDGMQFTLDPSFKATVEVVDDGADGADNGAKFFETFKYKQDRDGNWVNKENSKLGQLTTVAKPRYFEDETVPELTEEDLEDFHFLCRIKPRKNPNTGQVTGSTIDWETFQRLKEDGRAVIQAVPYDGPNGREDWEDIPF